MEGRAHPVSRASTSQTRGTQLAITVERESFLNQRGNPPRAPALAVRPTQTRVREVIRPRTVLATRDSQGPMVVHVWGAWRASSKQRPGMQRTSTVGLESTLHRIGKHPRAHACNVPQTQTRPQDLMRPRTVSAMLASPSPVAVANVWVALRACTNQQQDPMRVFSASRASTRRQ